MVDESLIGRRRESEVIRCELQVAAAVGSSCLR